MSLSLNSKSSSSAVKFRKWKPVRIGKNKLIGWWDFSGGKKNKYNLYRGRAIELRDGARPTFVHDSINRAFNNRTGKDATSTALGTSLKANTEGGSLWYNTKRDRNSGLITEAFGNDLHNFGLYGKVHNDFGVLPGASKFSSSTIASNNFTAIIAFKPTDSTALASAAYPLFEFREGTKYIGAYLQHKDPKKIGTGVQLYYVINNGSKLLTLEGGVNMLLDVPQIWSIIMTPTSIQITNSDGQGLKILNSPHKIVTSLDLSQSTASVVLCNNVSGLSNNSGGIAGFKYYEFLFYSEGLEDENRDRLFKRLNKKYL